MKLLGIPIRLDAEIPPHIVRLVNRDGGGVELNLKRETIRAIRVAPPLAGKEGTPHD